jgi:zinc protease
MSRFAPVFVAALLLGAGCGPKTPTETVVDAAAELPGGIQLLEEVTKSGDEIAIPYRKFVLPNGLKVVLHKDDSDPLVHVDVTYHVGSAREDIGKSGFAHFFEHMMFQGSENVADEEHFKIITEAGGTLNGTTNSDRTNYFETVPSNQLEKMLWLEADRMGFLLDAVTQEKFETQRETVKNERGQRVDNAPYGRLGERVGEAMYPAGHPYSWSVIGYLEDLDRADVDDLKRFFLRWYGPNNATLTIGGRFDEAQALEWVNKYYGTIPAGPAVEAVTPPVVTLDADRYLSMEDEVALPLVYMEWPTVHANHPDEAPLDVLMSILGDGKTALLYKNLVKEGKAVQASANHGCMELHCTFTLYALPNPASGTGLPELEKTLRASLAELETRGVLDDDLTRVKAGIVAGKVFGLESVSGKVSQLAYYETFQGNPGGIQADIARYENVTKEDVMRVYETYIKGKPAVVMSVVPTGKLDGIAHADTFTRPVRVIPEKSAMGEVEYRRATDTFDRSVKPPAGSNPTLTLPTMWKRSLANGIEILGAVNAETPTTAVQVRIPVGQKHEPIGKLGLASLTAGMLNEASTKSTNEELSNALDKLGSSVSVSSGEDYTTLQIRSLTKNLDATIAIALERWTMPAFSQEDFDRLKDQVLQGIEQSKTEPSVTAGNTFKRLLFGADNAFAYPDEGTTASVTGLTLQDVKGFYEANYKAGGAEIMTVTDVDADAMATKLEGFASWTGDAVAKPALKPFPELKAGTLYLVDKKGAAQSEIRIGKRSMPYDMLGTQYRARLMNYPLGQAFNSRINLNLREDKGYTYGARGTFRGDPELGYYSAGAGVRTDTTSASIVEFMMEIDKYQASGITPEELEFTKQSIGQSTAREYETPSQKLGFLADILTFDLPADFTDQQTKILESLTKEEVDALAKEYLNSKEMILVVVGDSATILPSLKELGYPIVKLDADGKVVK